MRRVAAVSEVRAGFARVVEAEGQSIALYNVGGTIYATSNICTHQGAPLNDGVVSGTVVTCPWHAWRYDIITGQCKTNPQSRIRTYPVEVKDGQVYVNV